MSNDIFQFDCPCCGKRIEFGARARRARAAKVAESKVKKDFDALLSDQKAERTRLDSAFGRAVDDQRKEKETLDEMFKTAKRRAQEEPEEKPLRPFDLD
jgi:hypothetical protein